MSIVVSFNQSEPIQVDRRHVAALCRHHGVRRAEELLLTRIESISRDLQAMRRLRESGRSSAIVARAERLSEIAASIGLTTLARVARDVALCARSSDGVAFGAVWARLDRVGERSIYSLWTLPGLQL